MASRICAMVKRARGRRICHWPMLKLRLMKAPAAIHPTSPATIRPPATSGPSGRYASGRCSAIPIRSGATSAATDMITSAPSPKLKVQKVVI